MTTLRDAAKSVYDFLLRRKDPVPAQGGTMSPTLLHTLESHTGWISSVAFVSNSDHLVSGSRDGTVKKWRVSDGREVGKTMNHGRPAIAIAVSPDGKLCASGGEDGGVVFWSIDTCEKMVESRENHLHWVWSLSFAPDSRTVASGSWDRSIILWSALTGERIAGPFGGHMSRVTSIAFCPSGNKVASCDFRGGVRIWDIRLGQEVGPQIRGFDSSLLSVVSLIWSLDSRQLICGGRDGTIRIFDSSNGALLKTCRGHTGVIGSIAVPHDGALLASASRDRTIRVWNISTCQQLACLEQHDHVNSVSMSSNGQYLASGGRDRRVNIWRLQDVDPVSQECKENSAASDTNLPNSQPQHVGSDDQQHRLVDHPTTVNGEADNGDPPEGPGAGAGDRPNQTTANDSYLDLPVILPSRPAVNDSVHTQFFDLGDPEVTQPNVTSNTHRGTWKKKAKGSRQYLSQRIRHFRERMLPRHGASDVSGPARPSSSQKLKDRISRIRRRTSLVPENDEGAAQGEGSEQSPNDKGKTPKLKPVLVAANRLRQVLVVAAPPRHVEQEKWYFVKRDGKLIRVPGPSTQPCAQGSSQLIAGLSNVASGGQAQGQSQQTSDDVDIDLCGCCAWIKR